MPRKKKPFINPDNAAKFTVVHRSQRDPAIADPDATPHVLVPAGTAAAGTGPYMETVGDKAAPDPAVRLGDYEFGDLGLPDDGYDYSQHLKVMGQSHDAVFLPVPSKPKNVNLPAEALPSTSENEVGMLNLAAPRGLDLTLDPDIVAALDDSDYSDADVVVETVDFDGDGFEVKVAGDLEDDFVALANEERSEGDADDASSVSSGGPMERHVTFEGGKTEEHKPRQHPKAAMSVASSLYARGGVPTIIDEQFDVVIDKYDDDQIGEISDDEDDDDMPMEAIEGVLDEFLAQKAVKEGYEQAPTGLRPVIEEEEEESERVVVLDDLTRDGRAEKWDVETVLTTLTNTDNIPGMIGAPGVRVSNRTGLAQMHERVDEPVRLAKAQPTRTRDETAEQRRERKNAVKAERRMRRQQKKMTKESYVKEAHRQKTTDAGQATAGMKL